MVTDRWLEGLRRVVWLHNYGNQLLSQQSFECISMVTEWLCVVSMLMIDIPRSGLKWSFLEFPRIPSAWRWEKSGYRWMQMDVDGGPQLASVRPLHKIEIGMGLKYMRRQMVSARGPWSQRQTINSSDCLNIYSNNLMNLWSDAGTMGLGLRPSIVSYISGPSQSLFYAVV